MKLKLMNNLGAAFVLALSATVGLTGCQTGDRYTESTGESIDDAGITHHVKDALGDDIYKYPDVKVTTFKGTVQLSGFVDLSAQKSKAGDLAKAVPGAREVVNNITVKNREGMSMTDDATLTRRVREMLADDIYKYPEVQVMTRNGTVQLSGFVNDRAQKDKAGDVAKSVPGVRDVVNNIVVKSGN